MCSMWFKMHSVLISLIDPYVVGRDQRVALLQQSSQQIGKTAGCIIAIATGQ